MFAVRKAANAVATMDFGNRCNRQLEDERLGQDSMKASNASNPRAASSLLMKRYGCIGYRNNGPCQSSVVFR
jgi:hypothetical protein